MRSRGKWIVGACAAVLIVLIPFAPKAHAVVATLVNVANSAAAPAISQDVAKLASQNIMLRGVPASAVSLNPGTNGTLDQMLNDGTVVLTPYVVPSGQSLVVTSINLNTGGPDAIGGGFIVFGLVNKVSGRFRESWIVLNNGLTFTFQMPTGLVFPSGESIEVFNYAESSGAIINMFVHGYLTTN